MIMMLLVEHIGIKMINMKLHYGKMTGSFALGIYITNWGYPVKYELEIGLYIFKWYIGLELFK